MKPISDEIYQKFILLTNETSKKFRSRGLAIPMDHEDGSVSLGMYTIVKHADGFYSVVTKHDVIAQLINLPQTAIMIANNMALGRSVGTLITQDANYGYALFEETLLKQSNERHRARDPDRANIMLVKYLVAKQKKDQYKKQIVVSFEKLRKQVQSV
jgi:hypothetical protein